MYIRVNTITGATDIDGGIAFLGGKVVPELAQMRGFRGLLASADRSSGVVGVLGLWESEDDLKASDSAVSKVRQEAVQIMGGSVTVETFEQVIDEVGDTPPTIGCTVLVRRLKGDPARLDEVLAYVYQLVPAIRATAGFRALRVMVNRQTGEGIVRGLWTDQPSMEAAREVLEPSALEEARARGAESTDLSIRELVYAHLQ